MQARAKMTSAAHAAPHLKLNHAAPQAKLNHKLKPGLMRREARVKKVGAFPQVNITGKAFREPTIRGAERTDGARMESLLHLGLGSANVLTAARLRTVTSERLWWQQANPYLAVTIKSFKNKWGEDGDAKYLSAGESNCLNQNDIKFRSFSGDLEVFKLVPVNTSHTKIQSLGSEGRFLCETEDNDLKMSSQVDAEQEERCIWKLEDAPDDKIYFVGFSGYMLRSDTQDVAEMDSPDDKGERKQFHVSLNGTLAPPWLHITTDSLRPASA